MKFVYYQDICTLNRKGFKIVQILYCLKYDEYSNFTFMHLADTDPKQLRLHKAYMYIFCS